MKKLIPNYTNYFIDDDGNVFNTNTSTLLKGSIGENGYKYYRLSKNNQKKMFYAHRLVAENFIPNPNHLPIVNHKDGNKLNNNINNLEWASYSDNIKHAHSFNLIQKRREKELYLGDFEQEEWKKIKDMHYLISNYGRIKNTITNRILKPSIACGYYKIRLSDQGKVQDFLIHYLVYQNFINNNIPKDYIIDHIDGNKLNNNVKNLRAISKSENVKQALYVQNLNTSCKKVAQLDKDGRILAIFPSIAEAGRKLRLDSSTIAKVCKGINKSHGGFKFSYI